MFVAFTISSTWRYGTRINQCKISDAEYEASKHATTSLTQAIIHKQVDLPVNYTSETKKAKTDVSHALSCKKGGFISQLHNELRDLTANILSKVCTYATIEPSLNELTGETLIYRSANTAADERLDVSARGVWTKGQRAFFNIRVFDQLGRRYQRQSFAHTYVSNEKEKKRMYNQRVLEVENGTFTPLVCNVYGGMGRECQVFYKSLSSMLAEKRDDSYSQVA